MSIFSSGLELPRVYGRDFKNARERASFLLNPGGPPPPKRPRIDGRIFDVEELPNVIAFRRLLASYLRNLKRWNLIDEFATPVTAVNDMIAAYDENRSTRQWLRLTADTLRDMLGRLPLSVQDTEIPLPPQ